MKNRSRLKILKISCIYGGVLSLFLLGLYVFFVVAFPGTVKFMLIQVVLLLAGIVSVTVFSYMHLISLSSGLIFIYPLVFLHRGDLSSVVAMFMYSIPGLWSPCSCTPYPGVSA